MGVLRRKKNKIKNYEQAVDASDKIPESEDLIARLEERDLLEDDEKLSKNFLNRKDKKGKFDKDLNNANQLFDEREAEEHLQEKIQQVKPSDLVRKNPGELFAETDIDGSGFIELDEFIELLPKLGVVMTQAKASRYFNTLDTDGSGALGLDEFKAALHACDPDSGNSIGFKPSSSLLPKDAFKFFDEDNSGRLDEDEFANVLEYLGFKVSETKQEKMFQKYDKDKSGYIEYNEFRKIYLVLSDVRGELEKRGVVYGKRTPKAVMVRRLEELLEDEEQHEEHALAQAKLFRDWQVEMNGRNTAIADAKRRAKEELIQALDVGGQVYVFGVGAHGQFSAAACRPNSTFKYFDYIKDLWEARVMPEGPVELEFRNIGQVEQSYKKRTEYPTKFTSRSKQGDILKASTQKKGGKSVQGNAYDSEHVNDQPGRDEIHALALEKEFDEDFRYPRKSKSLLNKILRGAEFGIPDETHSDDDSDGGLDEDSSSRLSKSTKSRTSVSNRSRDSNNSQNGKGQEEGDEDDDEEVEDDGGDGERQDRRIKNPFASVICAPNTCALWGHRVVHVSVGVNTAFALTDNGQLFGWGGRDEWWTAVNPGKMQKRGHLTNRSTLMLSMDRTKSPWPDVEEPDLDLETSEEESYRRLRMVTEEYYNVWEPSPIRDMRMSHMENIIIPRLEFEDVALTLSMRGFEMDGMNKRTMVDVVYEVMVIEMENCGKGLSEKFRAAEQEIKQLRVDGKKEMGDVIIQTVSSLWRPLHKKLNEWREANTRQREEIKVKREELHNAQYDKWRSGVEPVDLKKKKPMLSPTVVTERASDAPKSFPEKSQGFTTVEAGSFHVAGVSEGQVYTWGDGNYGRLGQGQGPVGGELLLDKEAQKKEIVKQTQLVDTYGGYRGTTGNSNSQANIIAVVEAAAKAAANSATRYDSNKPLPVRDLRSYSVASLSCGYSHTAVAAKSGEMFIWGGGNDGKLGLGPITEQYECYCPFPVQVHLLAQQRITQVSCGNAHTAAVTDAGHLFMWGCADGGRLGIGSTTERTVDEPRLVRTLQVSNVRIKQVSCGCTHTVACTVSEKQVTGKGLNKVTVVKGGDVYVAGPSAVLGKNRPRFHLVRELVGKPVKQVSAGYSITACVTMEGEMYSWGVNKSGCIGHPVSEKFVRKPKLVKCLYMLPKNLAQSRKARAKQSSVYNSRTADIAINGECSGDGESMCVHTQVDAQPYWEVDLGRLCRIEEVRLWNREDSPPDESIPRDQFTKRLFPCWIMVSPSPFERNLVDAHGQCSAKKKFSHNLRRTVWNLPPNTVGRYVRVQLERSSYLHFAELQVFGTKGTSQCVGRISQVSCSKEVTMAVSEPSRKQSDLNLAYLRAVKADPGNAFILRQYPTYLKSWDAMQFGAEEQKCPLDRGSQRCEMCTLRLGWQRDWPAGPNGRLRRLDSMANLLQQEDPPPLDWQIIKAKNDSAMANILAAADKLKAVFKKGGKKLLQRHIANDRFGITLQETDASTGYLLRQFHQARDEEIRQQQADATANHDQNNSASNQSSMRLACNACDICTKFEPLRFNTEICKVCTHLRNAHVNYVPSAAQIVHKMDVNTKGVQGAALDAATEAQAAAKDLAQKGLAALKGLQNPFAASKRELDTKGEIVGTAPQAQKTN